jgi:two-component sensor histidine kinase
VKKVIETLLPLVTLAYRDVELEMDLAPMTLPMRRMTSLALVVNEVALNALKHCGEGVCHIQVTSDCDTERGWARLALQDNGPGFPPGFDPDLDANIGIQLVTTLVRNDLNGTVSFTNGEGACVEIAFPLLGLPPAPVAAHAIVHAAGSARAAT